MAVGAHADDVEVGCGGTLAKASREGARVGLLLLTGSDYTGLDGVQRTPADVKNEQDEANSKLGVHEFHQVNGQTLGLGWSAWLVGQAEESIRAFKPDVLLIQWPGDSHQDHFFGAMASLSASRQVPMILAYEPSFPARRGFFPFRPQVIVTLGKEDLAAKESAMNAHRSQARKYGPQWVEGARARARAYGCEVGAEYGEAFEAVRMAL